jgi:hypothetical protein
VYTDCLSGIRSCDYRGFPGIIFSHIPDLNDYFLNNAACDIIWPKRRGFCI